MTLKTSQEVREDFEKNGVSIRSWAEANGLLPLRTRVTSHREFLLRPDLGRRLDDDSLSLVRSRCDKGVDVQLILADGLSAVACMQSGKQLHDAVVRACTARGLRVGTPVAARFACGSRTRSDRK